MFHEASTGGKPTGNEARRSVGFKTSHNYDRILEVLIELVYF